MVSVQTRSADRSFQETIIAKRSDWYASHQLLSNINFSHSACIRVADLCRPRYLQNCKGSTIETTVTRSVLLIEIGFRNLFVVWSKRVPTK